MGGTLPRYVSQWFLALGVGSIGLCTIYITLLCGWSVQYEHRISEIRTLIPTDIGLLLLIQAAASWLISVWLAQEWMQIRTRNMRLLQPLNTTIVLLCALFWLLFFAKMMWRDYTSFFFVEASLFAVGIILASTWVYAFVCSRLVEYAYRTFFHNITLGACLALGAWVVTYAI